MHVCISDSFCCTGEANTTLSISDAPVKKKKKINLKRKGAGGSDIELL